MFSLLSSSEGVGGARNHNAYSLGKNGNGIKAKRRIALLTAILFVLFFSFDISSQQRPPHSSSRTTIQQSQQQQQGSSSNARSSTAGTTNRDGYPPQTGKAKTQNDEEYKDDDDEDDDDDDDSADYHDEDEEPGSADEDEEAGDGEEDDDDDEASDLWSAVTAAPTAAPTPLPMIPDELLPKLPDTPAFNFKVPQSSGCFLNMTGEAQFSNYPKMHPLNNLVQVLQAGEFRPNADTGLRKRAICKYRRVGNFMHFPHMMQSFTRCMSFFLTFPDHERYIIRRAHRRYWLPFNTGISKIFKWAFGGKTMSTSGHLIDESSIVVRPMYDAGYDEGPYQGIAFQQEAHAEVVRQRTASIYNLTQEGCQPGKHYPVIGILNRNSTRSILNAEELQKYLSKMTDRPVDIAYFEGTTFLEQVQFMMQTDILVSPHGAQLTSINFMSSCGGVFEVFPPGYWFPHFFGPLAATSGLTHGYVYTGYDWMEEWKKKGRKNKKLRNFARELDVCVPLNTSLTVIGQMVDNWKTCCHNKLKAQGREDQADDSLVDTPKRTQ